MSLGSTGTRARRRRSPMPERYDVIIIGTGAGGGTLAHTLAPSGKKILLLERGDFLPREMENWDPDAGLRPGPLHLEGHLVRRRRQALPAAGALLRGRRDQALRRGAVPAAAAGLRRAQARRRHLAGVAAHATTTSSRTTRRPSGSTRCTATTARIRPKATWSKQYPWPAVSHEPRIQQLADDLAAAGYQPVPRALRHPARRGEPPREHAASAAPGATATRASCTRSPTPR